MAKKKSVISESFKHSRESGFVFYRFLAAVLDFVIIAFLCQLAFMVFGAPDLEAYRQMQNIVQGMARDAPEVIERTRLWNQFLVTALAIGAAYEGLLLMLFGATVGKLVFGFRVMIYKDDRPYIIKKLQLLLRAVVKGLSIYLLSAIPFILLCLTTFGNAEGRSGFDFFAGTKLMFKTGGRLSFLRKNAGKKEPEG